MIGGYDRSRLSRTLINGSRHGIQAVRISWTQHGTEIVVANRERISHSVVKRDVRARVRPRDRYSSVLRKAVGWVNLLKCRQKPLHSHTNPTITGPEIFALTGCDVGPHRLPGKLEDCGQRISGYALNNRIREPMEVC